MKLNKLYPFYFILFIITLLFQIYVAMSPLITFRIYQKIGIVSLGLLWLTLAMLNLIKQKPKYEEKRKIISLYLWVVFVIYSCNLIYLLFFDGDFGRSFAIQNNKLLMNMMEGINLKPLKMINDYIIAYQNDNIRLVHVLTNIVGNLIVFAPMGIFLPTLFKSLDSYIRFPIVIALMIIASEFLQVYFSVGVGDIDDFILNFTGAMIVFLIYKIPYINKKWKAFIYQEEGGLHERQ